jgi:alkanesulfonate monooxygenase SsuD/methylene tetrahydromethanopterin reductase-like flavin-dependent oxidoreductase (luciferase family)
MVIQNHKDYSDREMYKHELRLAIEAEGWGYDILWPVEHHFFDYSICPDNMQYLSYIAARTERIELATGAIIVPWNNPMRMVEKMVLLDHLSDGRAVLGLGRGLARREYRGMGVDMSEARDRFNEAAEMIVKGLETGFVEGSGKYYPQSRVEVRPRPIKSFKGRRYMVCMSPESFSVAASLGLGAMLFSQMSWEKVADVIWAYREEYRQKNSGEEAPPIHIADFVACYADKNKAEEVAREKIVGYYFSVMEHYEMLGDHFAGTGNSYQHYAKASEAMKAAGQDAVVEDFLSANLWGTPDMILAKLRRRRELIGDFEVNGAFSYQSIPYDQVEQCMRLFAKEVGPEIKSWKPSPQPRRTAVDVNTSAPARAGK